MNILKCIRRETWSTTQLLKIAVLYTSIGIICISEYARRVRRVNHFLYSVRQRRRFCRHWKFEVQTKQVCRPIHATPTPQSRAVDLCRWEMRRSTAVQWTLATVTLLWSSPATDRHYLPGYSYYVRVVWCTSTPLFGWYLHYCLSNAIRGIRQSIKYLKLSLFVCLSVRPSVRPKYPSLSIAVFVRSSSNLKCRSHI